MASYQSLDLKVKRLTHIEAEYRGEIKRAQHEMKLDPDRKPKYERIVAKYEKKIDRLLPKIRRLRELRSRVRS